MFQKIFAAFCTLALLISILSWTGCKETEDSVLSPTTTITLEKAGNLQLSFNKISGTDDVEDIDTVTAILTRSGYESVLLNLAIGNGIATGTMFDVSEGTWHLTINAKDTSGTVIYRGNSDVEINSDQTTYVSIELMAASTSGNLSINVCWEEGDGINWTKFANNPVLDLGVDGEWDDTFIQHPTVIFNGNFYEMWYTGNDGSRSRIGYASSTDGENWTKYSGNPVLDVGASGEFDASLVLYPTVIFEGNIYKLWYAGYAGGYAKIGYATSYDGKTWTKYSGNPVLSYGASTEWDDKMVFHPDVCFDGTEYKMWYTGVNSSDVYKIGYASSPDGINWTKSSSNPVIDLGTTGTWDDEQLCSTSTIFDGTNYKMWYSAWGGLKWQIGLATSSDGINWTKYSNNPIITTGTSGSWDETNATGPFVLYNGISYKMWYLGFQSTTQRIGYATSP